LITREPARKSFLPEDPGIPDFLDEVMRVSGLGYAQILNKYAFPSSHTGAKGKSIFSANKGTIDCDSKKLRSICSVIIHIASFVQAS
jgi:hypothetical protein